MRREDLTRADFDDESDLESREACRDVYDTLEVELLVPILYGVDLLGVIAVGRKLSGDHLAADDRVLLRTLVITSYSIHYTKLYEAKRVARARRAAKGSRKMGRKVASSAPRLSP